jgi:hypothetical protein
VCHINDIFSFSISMSNSETDGKTRGVRATTSSEVSGKAKSPEGARISRRNSSTSRFQVGTFSGLFGNIKYILATKIAIVFGADSSWMIISSYLIRNFINALKTRRLIGNEPLQRTDFQKSTKVFSPTREIVFPFIVSKASFASRHVFSGS